jgi:hypothetical protein
MLNHHARALTLAASVAAAATACGPPPEIDEDDAIEAQPAAAVAEQFFDASDDTLSEIGVGAYGFSAGRIRALGFESGGTIANYTLSLSNTSNAKVKTGKASYTVEGEKVSLTFTAKITPGAGGERTVNYKGSANGKSFEFTVANGSGNFSGHLWKSSSNVKSVSRTIDLDVFSLVDPRVLSGMPLAGSFDADKCTVGFGLFMAGGVQRPEDHGVEMLGEVGRATYCNQR